MATEKRMIDAKDFDLRVSRRSMTEVFPNWKELPVEVQDAVCKHGQYLHMLLETQPTVDAAPVVHGRWKFLDIDGWWFDECSICGNTTPNRDGSPPDWNYCPNCGAKMDSDNPSVSCADSSLCTREPLGMAEDGGGDGGGGTAV